MALQQKGKTLFSVGTIALPKPIFFLGTAFIVAVGIAMALMLRDAVRDAERLRQQLLATQARLQPVAEADACGRTADSFSGQPSMPTQLRRAQLDASARPQGATVPQTSITDTTNSDDPIDPVLAPAALLTELLGKEIVATIEPDRLAMDGAELLRQRVFDRDASLDQRVEAAYAIRQLSGAPVTEDIAHVLLNLAKANSDPQVQQDVLYALQGAVTKSQINDIAAFMHSRDESVRKAAIYRLGELATNGYVQSILTTLAKDDPSQFLRYLSRNFLARAP